MLARLGIQSEWLFPDPEGNPIHTEYIYKRWKFYAKQNGIETSIHELRHTFISMTQNTLPKPLLKRIVGHSASMDTDGVYGHEMDGDFQLAVDMMEGLLDRLLGSEVHT
jgi:integrase